MSLGKILIFEDEQHLGLYYKTLLKLHLFEVCEVVTNANHALELVEQHQPDLLLMDINLGGNITGIDAAIELKLHYPELPLIFVSGDDHPEIFEKAKKAKPASFVVKPFKDRQLISIIELVLQNAKLNKVLIDQDSYLNSLFQNAKEGIVLVDIETKTIIDANSRVLTLLDLKQEAVISRTLDEILKKPVGQHLFGDTPELSAKILQIKVGATPKLIHVEKGPKMRVGRRSILRVNIHDVTKQGYNEQRLRLLSVALNQLEEAVIITDSNLEKPGPIITYVNPAFEKITGYAAYEVIGKSPRILQGKDTDRDILDELKNTLNKGIPFSASSINYKKNGSKYHVSWNISPVRNEEGIITHFISVQRDITKEKQQLELLRESEKRFRSFADASDVIVYTTDAEGNVNYANEQLCVFTGASQEALMGDVWTDYTHKEDLALVQNLFEKALNTKEPQSYIYRLYNAAKEIRWVKETIKPRMSDSGEFLGLVGVVYDIHHQMSLIKEVEEKNAELEGIFNTIPDIYFIVDEEGIFLKYKAAFQSDLYAPPEAFLGKNVEDVLPPEVAKRSLEAIKQSLSSQSRVQFKYYLDFKDTQQHFQAFLYPLNKTQVLLVVRNITEEVKANTELEKTQQLLNETSNLAKIGGWEVDLMSTVVSWTPQTRLIHEVEVKYVPLLEELLQFYEQTESRSIFEEALNRLIDYGQSLDLVLKLVTAKSNRLWVRVKAKAEFNEGICVKIIGTIQDVNDQKKNEIELLKTKQLLQETNDTARIGGWEYDLIKKRITWTELTRRIHEVEEGYVPDIDNAIQFYKEGESREKITHAIDQLIQFNKPYDIELILVTAKGNERWIRTKGNAEFKNGKCIRLFGAFQDIDAQKKAEIDLIRLKELLNETSSVARVGGWEVNFEQDYIYWSKSTQQIHEVDEEFEFKHGIDGLFEERIAFYKAGYSRNRIQEVLSTAKEKGTSFREDLQIVTATGKTIWVRVTGAPEFKEGKCVRLLGAFQDIDKEKKAELNLIRTKELLNETNAVARVGGWEVNFEEDYIYWSSVTRQIHEVPESFELQYGLNEVIPQRISFYKEGSSRSLLQERFEEALKSGEPFQDDFLIVTATGKELWVRVKGQPEFKEGRCIRLFGAFQDIDEEKRAEIALKENQRILTIINNIQSVYLKDLSETDVYEFILQELLTFTESEYGFIGEVLHDELGNPFLRTKAITDISWDEASKAFYDKHVSTGMDFRNLNTLFGYTLKTGEITIANDPENDPRSGGLPRGHTKMDSFLGLPVKIGNELIGMIGIANAPSKYSMEQAEVLRPVLETIAQLYDSIQKENEIKAIEEERKQTQYFLESFMDAGEDFFFIKDVSFNYVMVNEALAKYINLPKEEIVGKTDFDFFDNFFAESCRRSDKQALADGNCVSEEIDNKSTIFESTKFAIALGNGQMGIGGIVRNVTDKIKTQRRIIESETKLRGVSNSIPGMLLTYVLHEDGTDQLLFASEGIHNLYHVTIEEALQDSKQIWKSIHPEDVAITQKAIERSASDLSLFEAEWRIIQPDGSIKWVAAKGYPQKLEKGTRWDTILLDITKEKLLREQLRSSEEKYRSMIEQLNEGVIIHAPDGKIIDSNEAASYILGVTRKQLLGMDSMDPHWRTIREDGSPFPGEEHPAMITLRTMEPQNNVIMGVFKSETELSWILISSQPLWDQYKNELIGIMVSFTDFTEIRAAEQKVLDSELRLNSIIQNATDAIITINEKQEIILFNQAAEKIFGYKAHEILDKKLEVLMESEAAKGHRSLVKQFGKGEITARSMTRPGLLHGVKADGTIFPIEVMISKVKVDGKLLFTAIVRDITERLEFEQKLKDNFEFIQKISDNIPGGVYQFELKPDGSVLVPFASKGIFELHPDVTAEQLANDGTHLFDNIDPEFLSAIQEKIGISAQELSVFEAEYPTFTSKRNRIWHRTVAKPERKEDGTTVWYGYSQDITAQRQAISRLEESERRFRELADAAPVLIWISDESKAVTYVNKNWTDFTGKNYEDELGDGWASNVHPDEFEYCLKIYTEAFDRRESFEMEYRLRNKHGEYRWMLDHGKPRFTEDGTFFGYVGSLADITEMKNSAQELEQQRELLKAIIDHIPDAIYMKDRDFKKVLVNKAELKYSGFDAEEEVIGKDDTELYGEGGYHEIDQFEKKVILSGEPVINHEAKLTNRKGEFYYLLTTKVPLKNKKGEIIGLIGIGKDITERKQMELKLSASENQLRLMLDSQTNFVLKTDLEGKYTYYNKKYQESFGWIHGKEDFLGDQSMMSILPESHPTVFEVVNRCLDNPDEVYQVEILKPSKDGGKRVTLWEFKAAKNIYGQPDGIQCMGIDITERVQAEQALAESEQRFRVLADNAPVFISTLDHTGAINYINKAWKNFFGVMKMPNLNEETVLRVHPEDLDRTTKIFRENFNARTAFTMQYRLRSDKGMYHWIDNSTVPLYDITGNWIGFLSTAIDITSVKEAELAMQHYNQTLALEVKQRTKELEQLNNQLLSQINQLNKAEKTIKAREYELQEAQRLALLGNWTLEMFEYEPVWSDLYYRQNGLDLVHPMFFSDDFNTMVSEKDQKAIQKAVQDCITFGSAEYQFSMQIGSEVRYISGLINRSSSQVGGTLTLFGISRDRTRERKAELELVAAKDHAEQLAKAKQQFLANMSHEIRTPINGIRGMSHLLAQSELSEEQEEFVRAIKTSSDTLLGLVNDILDIAKVDSGKIAFERTAFDLRGVLNAVTRIVGVKARDKKLPLQLEVSDQIPKLVIGDSLRLSQILTNILDNAVKFTEFGFVKLSAEIVGENREQWDIRFTVTDSGIGIPEHRIGRIFEVFEQTDSSITRKFGGSGLGLAIVKGLVEHQGGSIAVKSKEYEGTTFEILLPMGKPVDVLNEIQPQAIQVKMMDLTDMRILVVDDNPINRLWASKLLKNWGCVIIEAIDGIEAFEKMKSNEIDLVLMDLYMPEMDGYEASTMIRSKLESPKSTVPIIALTADVLDNQEQRCKDAGIDAWLGKPFEPGELHQLISQVTERMRRNQLDISDTAKIHAIEAHIDLSALHAIADGDIAFIMKLIKEFHELNKETIDAIKESLAQNDKEQLRKQLHRIKPNLEYLGAFEIHDMVQKLGDDLKKNDRKKSLSDFSERTTRLIEQLERLRTIMQEALNGG